MKRTLIILALVIAAFSTACNSKSDNYKNLISTEWALDEIMYADSAYTVTPPAEVTLIFADSAKTIAGFGGCNSFFGSYETKGDDGIDIEITGSTRTFCFNMDFEARYFDILDTVENYLAGNDELLLSDNGNKVTLIFKPKFSAYE